MRAAKADRSSSTEGWPVYWRLLSDTRRAMSRENVEVVQRALDAFNRRDLEAVERFSDPEVEMDWSRSRGLQAGIYRGQQAVRAFWSDFLDIFDQVTVSPEEFLDLGDRVVVPNRAHMRSRDGIDVQTQSALVVTLRDRRIVRWCLYQEKAEALEAVGLRGTRKT